MTAADKYSGSTPRRQFRRAAERRRAALGIGCVGGVIVALGVNFAGASDPTLQDRIEAARSDAGQLSDRVSAQTARIASLTEQAHQAGARAMVLNAQVQTAQARSHELATQLAAAERKLERLRSEYAAAVKALDQRLVAIYESDTPDYITVLLSSDGYDDLTTRSDYLQALHNADKRVADRVAALRDQVAGHVHEVADLKQQVDAQAQQLSSARASLVASQQAASHAATAVADARASTQESLSQAQGEVAQLEQQVAEQEAAQLRPPSSRPARCARLSGRPLLDPLLHRHLRVRRQLRGGEPLERGRRRLPDPALDLALLRRPGRAAGRKQGRAGPDRRPDLGRLRLRRLGLRRLSAGCERPAQRGRRRSRLSSCGRSSALRTCSSTAAIPPFFSFTRAPVAGRRSLRSRARGRPAGPSPRPAASSSASKAPPRSGRPPRLGSRVAARRLRVRLAPAPSGCQAGIDLYAERRQRPAGIPGLTLALFGQLAIGVVAVAVLGVTVAQQLDHPAILNPAIRRREVARMIAQCRPAPGWVASGPIGMIAP